MTQQPSLKALAQAVLDRNRQRNSSATGAETECNPGADFDPQKLHSSCGISEDELRDLAGDDWPEIEADPGLFEAFAHAVSTRRLREGGHVPLAYTKRVICAGCGPVWLWPSAPDQVAACPWCFNRMKGRPVPNS